MIQEAEKDKKEVVVRALPVDPKIQRLSITYNGSKGDVLLLVTNFENMKWISNDAGPNETVEKVTVQQKKGAVSHDEAKK